MDYDGAKAAPTVLAELLGNLRGCDFTVFRIGSRLGAVCQPTCPYSMTWNHDPERNSRG